MNSLERSFYRVALLFGLVASGACGDPGPGLQLDSPPEQMFADEVYPVLLRDCGFPACHGDPGRFFRVFGPGRTRADDSIAPLDPATETEIALSYERTRSNIHADAPDTSPLLLKPLDPSAGGASHLGVDDYGRDVYALPEHPGFQTLRNWILATTQSATPTTRVSP